MSLRVCSTPGCPQLVTTGACAPCKRTADKARGTRTERGYGTQHVTERRRWQTIIDRTGWPCARCGNPINTGDDWHLDHTDDRTAYLGPSCAPCNLSAAGKRAHGA